MGQQLGEQPLADLPACGQLSVTVVAQRSAGRTARGVVDEHVAGPRVERERRVLSVWQPNRSILSDP